MVDVSRLREHVGAAWPLYLALACVVVAYGRALNSPLYGDDYFYLVAARELSFADYTKAVFTPWGNEPLLPFTRDFWRPLAFLWFELSEPVFGGNPAPYHVANLLIHLASVVLVFLLAKRLDSRPAVAGIAAIVFGLYPGSFEAVTWISSVNSAGLPLALGSWMVFVIGTSPPDPLSTFVERGSGGVVVRWPLIWLSALLLGLALCFRESATALVPAMGLWYLLVQRRDRLHDWRTYLPFAPFATLGLAYFLLRTRLLTEPFANPDIYAIDSNYLEHWWFYMKNALLPFRDPVTGWRVGAQHIAGVVLLVVPLVALVKRRWEIVALSLGLIVSMLPYAAALLGVGQRYFYFSTPVLALAIGIVAADALSVPQRVNETRARAFYAGTAGLIAIAGVLVINSRITHWEDIGPERQQTWVDGLRSEHPVVPEGGTLYCANVPLILAVFGAASLEPTVRWYYPEVGAVVRHTDAAAPVLGPNDRFYDPSGAGDSAPQR